MNKNFTNLFAKLTNLATSDVFIVTTTDIIIC